MSCLFLQSMILSMLHYFLTVLLLVTVKESHQTSSVSITQASQDSNTGIIQSGTESSSVDVNAINNSQYPQSVIVNQVSGPGGSRGSLQITQDGITKDYGSPDNIEITDDYDSSPNPCYLSFTCMANNAVSFYSM